GGPRVTPPGDPQVTIERPRRALDSESGADLFGSQPRLDHLEGHLAPDRLELLGYPDLPHPALAEQVEEPIRPDTLVRVATRGARPGSAPGHRQRVVEASALVRRPGGHRHTPRAGKGRSPRARRHPRTAGGRYTGGAASGA